MKVPLTVFLVLFGCSMVVLGLPTSTDKESDPSKEVELIPHSTFGEQPIVDTGYGWSSPFGSFGGLFENIESVMTKMRQQMEEVFKRFPSISGGNGTDFSFSGGLPDDIDPSKVNTTSVTKVIDGHKVIINDTEYKNSGDNGGSFFHIRVIDVQPNSDEISSSAGEPDSKPTTVTKDRESVENSIDNEIVKDKESGSRKEKRYANLETFDYIDPFDNDIDNNIDVIGRRWEETAGPRFMNYPQPWFPFGVRFPQSSFNLQERYRQPDLQQSILSIPRNVQNSLPQTNFPQMSYSQNRYPQNSYPQNRYPQNNYPQTNFPQSIFSQNRYPQNSFSQNSYLQNTYPQYVSPQNWYQQSSRPQSWFPQPSSPPNRLPSIGAPLQNGLQQGNIPERYTQAASPPFDLSRDTYVNEILAQQGAPTNPDAEVFDVNSLPVQNSNRIRNPT